jgi:hypothetical protein
MDSLLSQKLSEPEWSGGTGDELMGKHPSCVGSNQLKHADFDLDRCYAYEVMEHKFFLHERETGPLSSLHFPYANRS